MEHPETIEILRPGDCASATSEVAVNGVVFPHSMKYALVVETMAVAAVTIVAAIAAQMGPMASSQSDSAHSVVVSLCGTLDTWSPNREEDLW